MAMVEVYNPPRSLSSFAIFPILDQARPDQDAENIDCQDKDQYTPVIPENLLFNII
jgi:hypothetical protein